MPIKPGSPTVAMPGYDVQVLDENGEPVGPGEEGNICIKLPLPPGTLPTLWNDDDRYVDSYLSVFPGYYMTGDGGYIDADGYVFVMGRTDDVINVAGHRLSTGSMEAVVATHPMVAECAVIGVARPAQGPGAARVRGAQGRRRHRPGAAAARDREGACATRSARWRRSRASSSYPRCRRPARARSCAARCAGSPTAGPEAPPSTIEDIGVLDVLRPLLQQTD